MYNPEAFRETDPATIYDFVDRNGFAVLTTVDVNGGPTASHLPLHLRRDPAGRGRARGDGRAGQPDRRRWGG